jgi:hypothetical protein
MLLADHAESLSEKVTGFDQLNKPGAIQTGNTGMGFPCLP